MHHCKDAQRITFSEDQRARLLWKRLTDPSQNSLRGGEFLFHLLGGAENQVGVLFKDMRLNAGVCLRARLENSDPKLLSLAWIS